MVDAEDHVAQHVRAAAAVADQALGDHRIAFAIYGLYFPQFCGKIVFTHSIQSFSCKYFHHECIKNPGFWPGFFMLLFFLFFWYQHKHPGFLLKK